MDDTDLFIRFAFQYGQNIGKDETVLRMLKETWGICAPSGMDRFLERLRNCPEITTFYERGNLVGLLEPIRINTRGDLNKIPKTFDELTGYGTWSTYEPEGDTIVLVDFTLHPSYRGRKVDGKISYSRFISGLCVKRASENAENVFTYSPNSERAIRLHRKNGAKPVLFIKNARPSYRIPDVVVFEYKSGIFHPEIDLDQHLVAGRSFIHRSS